MSPRRSLSSRCGLQMPVSRIHRLLRQKNCSFRIGKEAAIFLSAVLEYMISEMIELSGMYTHQEKKKRITPRFIQLAIRNDDELNRFLHPLKYVVPQGGVLPDIGVIMRLREIYKTKKY